MSKPTVKYSELVAPLTEHVAEFLETTPAAVLERTVTARDERNRIWIEADPRTESDRDRLYGSLGELDLLKYAQWHMADEEKMALHDEMVAVARKQGGRVLDCGGGIGDTTLAFAANGVDVTYVDFPGVCSDFARYRFEKFGCLDRVRQLSPADFWSTGDGDFDLIASIEVLEHLENPVRHAARYRELLRPGGHLFITTFFEHSARNPDHLPENDAYRRLFGGERKTRRRCVLTNLGFDRKRWYWFRRPAS